MEMYKQMSKDISWRCINKCLKTFHGDIQKKCLKTFHGDVQTNDAKATTYYDVANGVEARSY